MAEAMSSTQLYIKFRGEVIPVKVTPHQLDEMVAKHKDKGGALNVNPRALIHELKRAYKISGGIIDKQKAKGHGFDVTLELEELGFEKRTFHGSSVRSATLTASFVLHKHYVKLCKPYDYFYPQWDKL